MSTADRAAVDKLNAAVRAAWTRGRRTVVVPPPALSQQMNVLIRQAAGRTVEPREDGAA